jgi:hypothetical protein
MDCTHENCPVKYIHRPDPAEVVRLVDLIIQLSGSMVWFNARMMQKDYYQTSDDLKQARADLLKLVGGE